MTTLFTCLCCDRSLSSHIPRNFVVSTNGIWSQSIFTFGILPDLLKKVMPTVLLTLSISLLALNQSATFLYQITLHDAQVNAQICVLFPLPHGVLQVYLEFWNSSDPFEEHIPNFMKTSRCVQDKCAPMINETVSLPKNIRSCQFLPNINQVEKMDELQKLNIDLMSILGKYFCTNILTSCFLGGLSLCTLKPPHSKVQENFFLSIWDTSQWSFFVKFDSKHLMTSARILFGHF